MSDQNEITVTTIEPVCPKCGSHNWDCYDESYEWFEDENGDLYQFPVGYLKCKNCGARWADTQNDDKWIGDDEQAFGREDSLW